MFATTSAATRRLVLGLLVVVAGLLAPQLPEAWAQTLEEKELSSNSIYFTGLEQPAALLGAGLTLSVSYERLVWSTELNRGTLAAVRLRAGVGIARDNRALDVRGEALIVPLMASAALGTRTHQLEVGLGAVPEWWHEGYLGPSGEPWNYGVSAPRVYAGYRLRLGHFLVRLTTTVARDDVPYGIVVWPGLSIGLHF